MITRLIGALTVAAAIAMSGTAHAATASQPKGLDVSSYQHPGGAGINWWRVRHAGYTFVFIKATQNDNYVNPYYASDRNRAELRGLKVGAYAFATPNQSSGQAQANYLIEHEGHTTLAPVLDIEWNPYGGLCYGMRPKAMVNWIASFESTIYSHLHVYATINTPSSWWNPCTGDSHRFATVALWDENNHNSTPSKPVLPAGWSTWLYWQKSITGHIPGIVGNVDIDVRRTA